MKKIFIGDIHGQHNELCHLLDKSNFKEGTDQVYFTGDIINRGPDSRSVLEKLHSIKAKGVQGNHEINFLECVQDTDQLKLRKGMQDIKQQLGDDLNFWCHWIEQLPYFIEEEDFIVVHGGLHPTLALKDTPPKILANIRTWDGSGENLNSPDNPAWHDLYTGKKLVIYGHWAQQGLKVKENSIGLDTGCVYGEKLSALILPGRKIVQVDTLNKEYKKKA